MMQIIIDYSKCTSPLDCARCLKACPEAVLVAKPVKVEKFKETESNNYKLYAIYESLCTGCLECVNVCPVRALEIKRVA